MLLLKLETLTCEEEVSFMRNRVSELQRAKESIKAYAFTELVVNLVCPNSELSRYAVTRFLLNDNHKRFLKDGFRTPFSI